ncbi:hypothetical protein BKA80DRAFT_30649 [Phyllosticta citrichinensis]
MVLRNKMQFNLVFFFQLSLDSDASDDAFEVLEFNGQCAKRSVRALVRMNVSPHKLNGAVQALDYAYAAESDAERIRHLVGIFLFVWSEETRDAVENLQSDIIKALQGCIWPPLPASPRPAYNHARKLRSRRPRPTACDVAVSCGVIPWSSHQ